MGAYNNFLWTDCYMELADKILQFKSDRKTLMILLKQVFDEVRMKFPYVEDGNMIEDICPFTVMGSFNRGIKDENRIAILKSLKVKLSMKSEVPEVFDGIPVLNNMKAWFFSYQKDQNKDAM